MAVNLPTSQDFQSWESFKQYLDSNHLEDVEEFKSAFDAKFPGGHYPGILATYFTPVQVERVLKKHHISYHENLTTRTSRKFTDALAYTGITSAEETNIPDNPYFNDLDYQQPLTQNDYNNKIKPDFAAYAKYYGIEDAFKEYGQLKIPKTLDDFYTQLTTLYDFERPVLGRPEPKVTSTLHTAVADNEDTKTIEATAVNNLKTYVGPVLDQGIADVQKLLLSPMPGFPNVPGLFATFFTAYVEKTASQGKAAGFQYLESLIDTFANREQAPVRDLAYALVKIFDNLLASQSSTGEQYWNDPKWTELCSDKNDPDLFSSEVNAFVSGIFASGSNALEAAVADPSIATLTQKSRALVTNMQDQAARVQNMTTYADAYSLITDLTTIGGQVSQQKMDWLLSTMGVDSALVSAATPLPAQQHLDKFDRRLPQAPDPMQPNEVDDKTWSISRGLGDAARQETDANAIKQNLQFLAAPFAIGLGLAFPLLGGAVGLGLMGYSIKKEISESYEAMESGTSYRAASATTGVPLMTGEEVRMLDDHLKASLMTGAVAVAGFPLMWLGEGFAGATTTTFVQTMASWIADGHQSDFDTVEKNSAYRFFNPTTGRFDVPPDQAQALHDGAARQVMVGFAITMVMSEGMAMAGHAVNAVMHKPGVLEMDLGQGVQKYKVLSADPADASYKLQAPDGQMIAMKQTGEVEPIVTNIEPEAIATNRPVKSTKPKTAPAATPPENPVAETMPQTNPEDVTANNTYHFSSASSAEVKTAAWKEAGLDEAFSQTMIDEAKLHEVETSRRVADDGSEFIAYGEEARTDTSTHLAASDDGAGVSASHSHGDVHAHNGSPVPSGIEADGSGDILRLLGRARDASRQWVSETSLGTIDGEKAFIKVSVRKAKDGTYQWKIEASENVTPEMRAETLASIKDTQTEFEAAPLDEQAKANTRAAAMPSANSGVRTLGDNGSFNQATLDQAIADLMAGKISKVAYTVKYGTRRLTYELTYENGKLNGNWQDDLKNGIPLPQTGLRITLPKQSSPPSPPAPHPTSAARDAEVSAGPVAETRTPSLDPGVRALGNSKTIKQDTMDQAIADLMAGRIKRVQYSGEDRKGHIQIYEISYQDGKLYCSLTNGNFTTEVKNGSALPFTDAKITLPTTGEAAHVVSKATVLPRPISRTPVTTDLGRNPDVTAVNEAVQGIIKEEFTCVQFEYKMEGMSHQNRKFISIEGLSDKSRFHITVQDENGQVLLDTNLQSGAKILDYPYTAGSQTAGKKLAVTRAATKATNLSTTAKAEDNTAGRMAPTHLAAYMPQGKHGDCTFVAFSNSLIGAFERRGIRYNRNKIIEFSEYAYGKYVKDLRTAKSLQAANRPLTSYQQMLVKKTMGEFSGRKEVVYEVDLILAEIGMPKAHLASGTFSSKNMFNPENRIKINNGQEIVTLTVTPYEARGDNTTILGYDTTANHCVAVTAITENSITFVDTLSGEVTTLDKATFQSRYESADRKTNYLSTYDISAMDLNDLSLKIGNTDWQAKGRRL